MVAVTSKGAGNRSFAGQPSQRFKGEKGAVISPKIVGVVDSAAALRSACRLAPRVCDFLEWRADYLGPQMPKAAVPWIVTARHPSEGGARDLPTAHRRELFQKLVPKATFVDIEVRSLDAMSAVLENAKNNNVKVIASFHDFQKTPSLALLRAKIQRAVHAGAHVAKVATVTNTPADLARLFTLFLEAPLPLAVMGMGRFGKVSRLFFASCGSVLNYGWLSKPKVSGQWSVAELRAALGNCSGQ